MQMVGWRVTTLAATMATLAAWPGVHHRDGIINNVGIFAACWLFARRAL